MGGRRAAQLCIPDRRIIHVPTSPIVPVSPSTRFHSPAVPGRQFLKLKGVKPYIPDFKLAFEHFCIHTGG
mgnify:CR=1 FL=1